MKWETPASAEEFEARLRSIGEKRYHHLHPFNERMHAGSTTEEEFRGWVRNIDHDGLEYFRARLTRQPKDIAHLLELVLNHESSRAQQCDVLRSLLAVELAYGKSS